MTTTGQEIPPSNDGPYIAGDTLLITLSVTDDNGDPIDLSAADVEFAVAPYRGGPTLIEKTVGDGITITDPANGEIEIRVNGVDTSSLGAADGRAYPFDVAV
ncbi:hypothetical protein EXE43_20105, partial [Halorubrum sp. SS5]